MSQISPALVNSNLLGKLSIFQSFGEEEKGGVQYALCKMQSIQCVVVALPPWWENMQEGEACVSMKCLVKNVQFVWKVQCIV